MKIGIVGTTYEENSKLKLGIENLKIGKFEEIVFYTGKLKGKDIVLVKSELGRIDANVCVDLLITHFKVKKIIFVGLAEKLDPSFNMGDIFISTEFIQHEFDITNLGEVYGILPRMTRSIFKGEASMIELAEEVACKEFGKDKVWLGSILGGNELSRASEKMRWLRDTFNRGCVQIDSEPLARVCHHLKTPFVILSTIVDKKDMGSDSRPSNELVNNSKVLVEKILERI